MAFSINHPKTGNYKKETQHYVAVKITSKKYKLSSQQRFVINFEHQSGLGPGGKEGLLPDEVIQSLKAKITASDGNQNDRVYKLCYASKVHGFSTSTFHTKCDGTHDFLLVQQRSSNGRIFGGWFGAKTHGMGEYTARNAGYLHTRGNDPRHAWMYRVHKNKIEYAKKIWHNEGVYKRSSYMLTFGGGHDYMCRSDGYAYSNMDYDCEPTRVHAVHAVYVSAVHAHMNI